MGAALSELDSLSGLESAQIEQNPSVMPEGIPQGEVEVIVEDSHEDGLPDEIDHSSNAQNKQAKKRDRYKQMEWQYHEERRKKEELEKQLQEVQQLKNQFNTFISSQNDAQKKVVVDNLYKQREEALELMDWPTVNSLDRQINEMNLSRSNQDVPVTQMGQDELNFASKYSWYGKDATMTAEAKRLDLQLANDPYWGTLPVEKRLDQVAFLTLQKTYPSTPVSPQPPVGAPSMYRQVEPSSQFRPPTSSVVTITSEELDTVKRLNPGISDADARKYAAQLKQKY